MTPEDSWERQPWAIPGKNAVIAFDGRLDDREGLAEGLGLRSTAGLPDSQLVSLAWEHWRDNMAEHLVGDYAIAIFESAARRLWLTVSPQGPRTLYYYRRGDLAAFATTVPPLLAFPGVSRALDETTIADFLAVNNFDTEQTFFSDIARVCPGTAVTFSPSEKRRVAITWQAPLNRRLVLRDTRQYVEAAREVLDRAVASRLRCNGEVAILGSGGLDTSCMAVSATALMAPRTVRMVSMTPEEGVPWLARKHEYADETPHVEALTNSLPGLRTEFVRPLYAADLEIAPERVFTATGLPLRNVTPTAWMESAYRRLAETGASACLDGFDGNFTLSWDGTRGLSDMFRRGQWGKVATYSMALGDYRPRKVAGYLWRDVVRPFAPWKLRMRFKFPNSALRDDASRALRVPERMREVGHDPAGFGPGSSQIKMRLAVTRNRAFAAEFYGWVRAVYGIEGRWPLADTRVIEFCLSVPTEVFFSDGQPRALARQLLSAAGISPSITQRRTRGRMCPEWFARVGRRRNSMLQDAAALREVPLAAKLIDFDKVDRIFASWPSDASAALNRQIELDILLTRVIHVGAFIRWAEPSAVASARVAAQT